MVVYRQGSTGSMNNYFDSLATANRNAYMLRYNSYDNEPPDIIYDEYVLDNEDLAYEVYYSSRGLELSLI